MPRWGDAKQPVIEAHDVRLSFEDNRVLDGLSLKIMPG